MSFYKEDTLCQKNFKSLVSKPQLNIEFFPAPTKGKNLPIFKVSTISIDTFIATANQIPLIAKI